MCLTARRVRIIEWMLAGIVEGVRHFEFAESFVDVQISDQKAGRGHQDHRRQEDPGFGKDRGVDFAGGYNFNALAAAAGAGYFFLLTDYWDNG